MAVSVVSGLVGAAISSIGKKFVLKAFLKTFAAFTALSAVSRALAPKPNSGARMRGIAATTREPAASRKMIYGQMRVGGHVVFIGNSDEGATPDNNYLHLAIAFASHEIESYEEIYFNEDLVWDKTNGVDTDWTSVLDVYTHDGTQTTADAQLVADCFQWTNNHKLLGIAYVHFKMLWDGDKFPNGIPNITAKIKGKKVYDPRDINQSAATPSTWLWSDNPALVLRDYLTNRYGLDEDDSVISDEAVEAAADLCDETVSLADGGTQTRYRCDGQLDTKNNIKTNIEYILGSMGGFLTYTGGKYIMRGASYVVPTESFDESDVISVISTTTKQSRRAQYNTVKGVYVSSEANYKVCDYPAQVSSTYSVEDGAPLELDMPLPFVVYNQQAQRLAKIALNKSRQHISMSTSMNLKALKVKVGDNINISNTRLGFNNKAFEVLDYSLRIQSGDQVFVDLTLIETAAAVYDWTTSDEIDFLGDGEVTLDNGRTSQPVSNLTGTEIGLVGPDATLQTAYKLAWDLPDSRFIGDILISWYDVTGTLPQDLIQGFAGPEANEFLVTGLQPDNTYTFYVQTINLIGVKSDPVQLQNVLMAGDTTAPALPTQVEANGDYEGIIVTWLNPADVDFKHVEVHVSETNTAPALSAIPTAVIDGEQYIEANLNGGDVRYFFLRSVDFSGNKSAYTSSVFGIATSIRIKNLGLLLNQNAYPTDLPVAEIKEGEEYEVLTLGTTSAFGWGQLGSSGTVGNVFTATRDGGPEFGTGTVEHTSYVSNDGELALVGLNLNGTLRYGEDASVIWNGKPIDIPFNSSNNFTVLTDLAGKQGWIALDRNKTAPFDMSGTLPNLDVAFVYYFDGDWYYDDDSANAVQFNPDSFTGTTTGTDGTNTAKLLALGTLRTGTTDTIVEGGLFTDPMDLRLVELPENFIDVTKFATQLESDTYVSGTSGWKIERSGNTEFNDITARGTIFATAGSISESVQIGGVDLNDYVARVTGSLALLINKGSGGTTTNNGEGVLVGVEQGAAVNNQNGYITWDGAQVEIPANVTVSGSTFATQLENQQGFICFDANKETPFSVFSGTGYIDLDCAFVYKIGDQWYFDANDSATVGQTFTPSTLLGSDGSSATDLVALGYIETSTSDVILYGGLFGQPVPLELAAFPSDAIRSGTIGGITITDTKLFEGVGSFKDANTGFYLDNSGDFSLKDKLSFDNSTGELIVDGTVRADVIDIVDGALYGDIEASSVAAGQVGIDEVSESVYNEIKRRFINSKDGFYFSGTGTVDGTTAVGVPVTITSGDLSATALQDENIELECVLTYRFASTTNYSSSNRNIDILFQWSSNGTSWSNVDVDPDNLHTVTQTQTEFGYVYELNKVIRSTANFSFSYGYLRLRALPAATGSGSIWAEQPLAISFVADQAGLIVGSAKSTGEAQFPDGIIVDPGENVGIGELAPTANLHVDGTVQLDISQHQGFKVVATDDTANETFYAAYYDVNISGADALTADRSHAGLYIDLDSSATGGDISNRHRVYGIYSDVRVSGDSHLAYGSYSFARSVHSSGTVGNLIGAQNYGFANNSAGRTTAAYGAYNYGRSSVAGTGEIDSVYGSLNLAQSYQTSTDTGTILYGSSNIIQYVSSHNVNANQARGVWAEVQIDSNSNSWTLSNAYVVRAEFDNNDSINRTNNGYLFYGNYSGIQPTNAWGVYIVNDVPNYFAGDIGIGTSANLNDQLTVGTNNDAFTASVSGTVTTMRLGAHQTGSAAGRFDYNRANGLLTYKEGPYDSEGDALFAIDNSGKVGISNSSPSAQLSVGDNTDGSGVVGISIGSRTVSGSTDLRLTSNAVINSDTSINYVTGSSAHIFYTGGTDADAGTTGASERMRIDSSGKVGIGTSSPSETLDVAGTFTSKGLNAYDEAAKFKNNGDAVSWARSDWVNDQATGTGIVYRDEGGNFVFRNDNSSGSGVATRLVAGNTTKGNIEFYSDVNTRVSYLDTAGNFYVGRNVIGDRPISRVYYDDNYLDIFGFGLQFERTTNYIRPSQDGTKSLYFGNIDASLDWSAIYFRSLNGLYMTGTQFLTSGRNLVNIGSVNCGGITASGDLTTTAELGVGTTNPSWDAHIYGSGPTLMLESNSTADAELRFGYLSSTTARIRESGDDLIFEAQGIGSANECIKTRPARTDILSGDTYIQSNTRLGGTSQMRINSSSSTAIMEGSSSFYVLRQSGGTAMSFQLSGSTETYAMTTLRISPSADNTRDLGSSTRRWQDVYSAGGVTTSSDERLKQQIRDIDEAERRVAVAAKGLLKAYKYNDAVEKKGDDARWHFGIIAQELKAAFEAEGLDAHDYGMLVYNEVWEADEWVIDVDSESGGWYTTKTWDTAEEAPNHAVRKDEYSIRYQELLAFIIAAL